MKSGAQSGEVMHAAAMRRVMWGAYAALAALAIALFAHAPVRHFMTPFREGQTALLAAELARGHGHSWLSTPTPVFGYPWDLPMEFPFFQRLVALASHLGLPLDFVGRALNAVFTLGAVVLGARLLRSAGISRELTRVVAALVLISPLYFGYGSAFLIEGCALFFAVAMIALIARGVQGNAIWPWVGAVLASMLAGLIKPTTWAPAMAGVAAYCAVETFQRWRSDREGIRWGMLVRVGIVALATVAVVGWWVSYSDAVKAMNPLGSQLRSGQLTAWNYGTLSQKVSPVVWLVIVVKTLLLSFGVAGLLTPVLALWIWRKGDRAAGTTVSAPALMAAGAAALSAPLVFTNLHLQHDYYQFANAIYVWALVAFGLAALERAGQGKFVRLALWGLLLSCAATTFGYVLFRQSLRDPADDAVLTALTALAPGKPVAAIGFDYSGRLPYYAQRPALMTITAEDVRSGRWEAALRLNSTQGYGAVVVASPRYLEAGRHAAHVLGLADPVEREIFPRTFLIAPADARQGTESAGSLSTEADQMHAILSEVSGQPSGYRRISTVRTAAGWPCGLEVVFKRRDQVFVFRSRELTFTRIRAVD